MLWTIVRVQWTILKRDKTVWFSLALFVGLLVYAGIGGLNQAEERREQIKTVQTEEAQRLQHLEAELTRNPPAAITAKTDASRLYATKESNPYHVGHELGRRTVSLQPGPLALLTLDSGNSRSSIFEVTLESELKEPELSSRPISMGRMTLGSLDMAFVLIYLLPLLIIALTYDLLIGEREQKTLALVLSQPVSMASFIVGKMIARGFFILLAALGPALVLWSISASGYGSQGVVAIVLGLIVLVSYIVFWMAAAMVANTWMRSSAASALALMGLWLACLVLVPGLVQIGVEVLYPPPSRVALVNITREAAQGAENTITSMEGDHSKKPDADNNYQEFLDRKVKAHEHMDEALHDVLNDFDKQLAQQQKLVQWLQVLSPSVAVREAFSDIAGDGVHRHQFFKAQAQLFHDGWKAKFYGKIKAGSPVNAQEIKALPAFEHKAEAELEVVERVILGQLAVWLFTLLMLMMSLARTKRVGRL